MTASIEELRQVVERARAAVTLVRPPTALGEPWPWNYADRARVLARHADAILDLTTGTGEVLAGVLDTEDVDAFTVAADRRARHLSDVRENVGDRAHLLRATPEHIPFHDNAFELILLRHRPYDPRQLTGLVAPGGAILTEQIHAKNWHELRTYFPRIEERIDDFELSKKVFRQERFEFIDLRTHDRPLVFEDLAHLTYVLASSRSIVPDFSLEQDADALFQLAEELSDGRGIVLTRSRYLIEVRRRPSFN